MTTSNTPDHRVDDAQQSNGPPKHPPAKHPPAKHESASKRQSSDAGLHGHSQGPGQSHSQSPKKRRKVNHACIYCRRSHMTCDLDRPCARCIKRNIGHLCHDEPRESAKRQKTDPPPEEEASPKLDPSTSDSSLGPVDRPANSHDAGLNLAPPTLPHALPPTAPIAQPVPVSAPHNPSLAGNNQSFVNYNDLAGFGSQNFHDMHAFHPNFMFNTSEASNEYNLLNDFLSNSLMDDGALYTAGDDMQQQLFSDPSLTNAMGALPGPIANPPGNQQRNQLQPPSQAATGNAISRPPSGFPLDKARETYYLTAADPAGTDTPEERMNKLLKAKFDAGMLKPFNYMNGYGRLNLYMERNFQPASRQKILRCMDRFRPKFRERVQTLTDVALVRVEMWFERCLMEYDRVFASMPIPACCWRRTGEIFRGNEEMAELVNVPMENLRNGQISLHDIIEETSLVSYWEKYGEIAFDSSQKAILTSCSLKNPDPESKTPAMRCCFSFTIRRDEYNIPALIVGNFLPIMSNDP